MVKRLPRHRVVARKIKFQLKDRLGEPLHLNLLSLVVRLFGSFRAKVAFDLVERRKYAFPLLKAEWERLPLEPPLREVWEACFPLGGRTLNAVPVGTTPPERGGA